MTLEVALDPPTLAVAPGARGVWTLRIRNCGDAAAACPVAVTGEAAAWAWVTPAEPTVAPGDEAEVRISVRLPPPPAPAAGPLPLTVEVAGVVVEATLQVHPVVEVSAWLGKPDARGTTFPLTVRNQGNRTARASLAAEGASVSPGAVEVEAGGVATATVTGRRGAFTVEVRPEGGERVVVAGTVDRARRRVPAWRAAVPVGLAALLVAGLVFTRGGESPEPAEEAVADGEALSADPTCPVRGHLAADPAGLPPRQVPIPDDYAFLEVRPGGCLPVRFNPCEPVHYVTNLALAPPGAMADLEAAFAQLSAATGIEFVHDGPTDEAPSLLRSPVQPDRYPGRWAPILIAWDHGERHGLEPTNPGGGRPYNAGGVYMTGFLILNADAVQDARRTPLDSGFGPGATWGRVMIHELAHLVGLGHVRTSREIMFHDLGLQRGRAEYHAGDLQGLRLVGREAGCLDTPPVPARPRR